MLAYSTNGHTPDGRAYLAGQPVHADLLESKDPVAVRFLADVMASGGAEIIPGTAPLPEPPRPSKVIQAAAVLTQESGVQVLGGMPSPDNGMPPPDPTGVGDRHDAGEAGPA